MKEEIKNLKIQIKEERKNILKYRLKRGIIPAVMAITIFATSDEITHTKTHYEQTTKNYQTNESGLITEELISYKETKTPEQSTLTITNNYYDHEENKIIKNEKIFEINGLTKKDLVKIEQAVDSKMIEVIENDFELKEIKNNKYIVISNEKNEESNTEYSANINLIDETKTTEITKTQKENGEDILKYGGSHLGFAVLLLAVQKVIEKRKENEGRKIYTKQDAEKSKEKILTYKKEILDLKCK